MLLFLRVCNRRDVEFRAFELKNEMYKDDVNISGYDKIFREKEYHVMKTIKRLSMIMIVVSIIIIGLMFGPKAQYEKDNPFISQDGYPLVIAHGGGQAYYPDNTMRAFEYAHQIGVDVLEMDVMITSDDVVVVSHGQNDTGNLITFSECDVLPWKETYETLKTNCNMGYNYQVDDSYPYRDLTTEEVLSEKVYLPKLDEVFETFGRSILYNIELKIYGDIPAFKLADETYDLMAKHDVVDVVLLATAHDETSQYVIETYPDLYLSTSLGSARTWIVGMYSLTSLFLGTPPYAGIQVPTSYGFPVIETLHLDTRHLIRTAQQHNMAMHYWTINDEETMRLLIRRGADGIITDDPLLLMSIISDLKGE